MIKNDIVEVLLQDKKNIAKDNTISAPLVVIGETIYVNTITYHYIGRVVGQVGQFALMEKVAWLPENPNMDDFFEGKMPAKYRKIPGIMRLNLDAAVCLSSWPHPLP